MTTRSTPHFPPNPSCMVLHQRRYSLIRLRVSIPLWVCAKISAHCPILPTMIPLGLVMKTLCPYVYSNLRPTHGNSAQPKCHVLNNPSLKLDKSGMPLSPIVFHVQFAELADNELVSRLFPCSSHVTTGTELIIRDYSHIRLVARVLYTSQTPPQMKSRDHRARICAIPVTA
jgi:hypothetical protein